MTNVERARELTEQIKANIWTGNMEPMILVALNKAVKEKDEALRKIMLIVRDLKPNWDEMEEIAQNALTKETLPTFDDVKGILKD